MLRFQSDPIKCHVRWQWHGQQCNSWRVIIFCMIKETLFIQDLKPALNLNISSEKLILYLLPVCWIAYKTLSLQKCENSQFLSPLFMFYFWSNYHGPWTKSLDMFFFFFFISSVHWFKVRGTTWKASGVERNIVQGHPMRI